MAQLLFLGAVSAEREGCCWKEEQIVLGWWVSGIFCYVLHYIYGEYVLCNKLKKSC